MSAEYCQNEEFRAGCASSSVVVMRSARYGRMSVGRCVRRDYGFVGCGSDVLAITDQLCSGRRNCTVRVPNSWYDDAARRARCPEDFKNYLQVAYDCVDGQCCDLHRERKCADTIGTVPAGSMGWPFPVLNSTRKSLWFEITKMLVAVFKNYLQVAYDCVDGQCCNLYNERKCAWHSAGSMVPWAGHFQC